MKFLKRMMMVAVAAILSGVALAETHTLMPYAYVQAHGTNRVDTGYKAKPLSRYFVDYQLVKSSTAAQGIFGDSGGAKIKCAFYVPANATGAITWYYRSSGDTYKMAGIRDTNRRVMTAIHTADSSGTATVSLYDRTDSVVSNTTAPHAIANTATTIYLFALNKSDATYIAGEKRIYSFEAADSSSAVMPTLFFAPTTNDVGEAGFKDIMTGAFHGEANANRSKVMTFRDGVGSADDYKYENGTFSAKFRAYAEDTTMGSVKFGDGDGEASDTAEAWVDRGRNVTVTAVPAEGYEFVGWTGDTWAITSGTKISATVTVQSGTAIQLLAMFSERTWHWTGAAGDSNWFTAGNWADGSGTAATALASGDKFTFDQSGDITVTYNPSESGFRVESLRFAPSAGAVMVTGGEIASVSNIVCMNGRENVMSCAVTFSGDVDVTAVSGHVLFAGGAKGTKVANHTDLYGNYNLTVDGDYVMDPDTILKSGSTLRMPNGTFYKHLGDYSLESCATTIVKRAKINIDREAKLMLTNDGVFVVTDNAYVSARGVTNYTQYLAPNNAGVFIANEVNVRNGARCFMGVHAVMGPGGINLDTNCYVRLLNLGTSRFGAYADWEIGCDAVGVSANGPAMYRQGGNRASNLTFDTSDYYDPSIGRTITLKGPIGDYNYDGHVSNAPLNITVAGVGTLAFDYTNNNYAALFSSGLTVKDSATVSVVPGISPGAGTVTLTNNATLKVAGSGTVALAGNLTLGENAALAFNFTKKDAAPVLSIPAGSTIPATVNVKVSAADGVRLRAGTYAITSGYDFTGKTINLVDPAGLVASIAVDGSGNIVLAPNVKGFIISVK